MSKQQQPRTSHIGYIPPARPEDRVADAQSARAASEALRQSARTAAPVMEHRRWKQVRMRAFHELGNSIAHIEAIERGEDEMAGGGDGPRFALYSLTPAEQLACLRGACLRGIEATERNVAALSAYNPATGEDLVLVEVRVKAGGE